MKLKPMNWKHKDSWTTYDEASGIVMEICHWNKEDPEKLRELRMRTSWNYYATFFESKMTPEKFNPLWLDEKEDYMSLDMGESEWNGGLTFYEKGTNKHNGKRWVKVGCDFAHIWDYGRGEYEFDEIQSRAERCLEKLTEFFGTNLVKGE